jgi:hypothetical protein
MKEKKNVSPDERLMRAVLWETRQGRGKLHVGL